MIDQNFSNLVSLFNSLPGIGKKSATRIAFHFLRMTENNFKLWNDALVRYKELINFCDDCGGLSSSTICDICNSPLRDDTIICVIEQPEDIFFIEETGVFRGKYHVLNGAISPIDGIGPDSLKIVDLERKVSQKNIKEVILATNPNLEGDATARYISDKLNSHNVKISRLAYGIKVGTTIEYSDQYSLGKSIQSRISIPH